MIATDERAKRVVLLVDDEETVRRMLGEMLTLDGYTVIDARDGAEALEILGGLDLPVDLVLTDVVMPRLGGPRFADLVRRAYPLIRIVFMSGFMDDVCGDGNLADQPGCGFLQKPFGLDELKGTLERVLAAA